MGPTDRCPTDAVHVALRELRILGGASAEDRAEIGEFSALRKLASRQNLVCDHDPCLELHHVRSGLLKLSRGGADGAEQILDVAGAGRLLGLTALFSGKGHVFTATAVVDCELVSIDAVRLLRFMEQRPMRLLRLTQQLALQHDRMLGRIGQLIGRSAAQRVALHLLAAAPRADRRQPASDDGCGLLGRHDLAALLGLTPETLSRELARFRRQGWIAGEAGEVAVLDEPSLVEFLGRPDSRRGARNAL